MLQRFEIGDEIGALFGAQVRGLAVRIATAVAKVLAGSALGDHHGAAGAAWAPGGQPRAVFAFTVVGGKVTEIEIFADPDSLKRLEVKLD